MKDIQLTLRPALPAADTFLAQLIGELQGQWLEGGTFPGASYTALDAHRDRLPQDLADELIAERLLPPFPVPDDEEQEGDFQGSVLNSGPDVTVLHFTAQTSSDALSTLGELGVIVTSQQEQFGTVSLDGHLAPPRPISPVPDDLPPYTEGGPDFPG